MSRFDSSLNRIKPKNQQEPGLQKITQLRFVVWLDVGGVAVALPFANSLVRHLVYQRLLGKKTAGRKDKQITRSIIKRWWKNAPLGKNLALFRHFICI